MILYVKLDVECVEDGDINCNHKINKDCFEAGELGGVCEFLCVIKVLEYKSVNGDICIDAKKQIKEY